MRSHEVHAFFTIRENNKEYDVIRMDRIDGYSLADIMSNPTKYSNWFDFKSLSKDTIIQAIHTAFEAIHAKELVHGDMAERNIMIDKNGAFYTIDYGRAEEISHLLTDQKNVIRQTDKTKCAQAIQSFFYVLKLRNVID